jgi:tetrahydromethanopterin S-methyltransferase subunit F
MMININNGTPGDETKPGTACVIIGIVLAAVLCGALALVLLP